MSLRHLAVAGGVALLSAHLFRSLRAPQDGAPSSAPIPASSTDASSPYDLSSDASSSDASSSDASSTVDRPRSESSAQVSSEGGEPTRLTPLEGAAIAESLREQERPELGLPSDTRNDADRVRPGLADFARGA